MTQTFVKMSLSLRVPPSNFLATVYSLTLVVLITSGCAATRDQPFVITPEQFDAVEASGVDEEPPLRGQVERGAPMIIVETPDPEGAVSTPFLVRVRFEPQDGATIALGTLKIKYGWFDVTEGVLQRMTVTGSGIIGQIDAIKPGNYSLKVSISDDRQRTGRAKLKFTIAK